MSQTLVRLRLDVRTRLTFVAVLLLVAFQVLSASPARAAGTEGDGFVQTNLVSNIPGLAANTDAHLQNPWGIVHGPTHPWWVPDNNGNVSLFMTATATRCRPSRTDRWWSTSHRPVRRQAALRP